MLKNIGMFILIVGIGFAGVFAVKVTPDVEEQLQRKHGAALTGKIESSKKAAYCAGLGEALQAEGAAETLGQLSLQDGCTESPKTEGEPTPAVEKAAFDEKTVLTPELNQIREAWLASKEAAAKAARLKAEEGAPTPAGERLSNWLGANGLGFGFGFVLIVVGALMSRRAIRAEVLSGDAGSSSSGGAVDFGEMLNQVHESIASHVEEMNGMEESTAEERQRFIAFIDDTKLNKIDVMVEARTLLEVKYGVAGYASVFGPFSRSERYLNRTWAALVDAHWPEAKKSMATASGAMGDAKEALDALIAAANESGS